MSIVDNITTQTTMDVEAPPVVDGVHAVIADILSNLYGHVEEAVIREYVANGIDATNAANSDAHVELTLPDAFEHNLIIQDFGTGMTPHEAKVHFATYGNSTKVGDPDFIGNIGAGAKAGFAVSTMILLETTKNGVTTSFNYTWFDGAGPQVVGETVEETGKPNGTTVTIPVDPSRDWETAAKRALLYTGSRVKIDGEVLVDPRGENPPVMHRMTPEERNIMGDSRVVMAGANFRVPEVLMDAVAEVIHPAQSTLGNMVIEVPNKALEFTPSRENIKDTPANTQRIKDIIAESYAEPINAQHLADNPFATYRNVRNPHGSGLAVEYITAEIKDHIEQVEAILDDVQETYGLVGVTYTNGSRRTWSGEERRHNSRSRYYGGYRDTITDGLRAGQIGAADLMFVHSPEGNIHRSPKVRAWIIDQLPRDYMVISVPDAALFSQIASAKFSTMDEKELRAYKPANYIPPAKHTAVRYVAYDLYQQQPSYYRHDGDRLSPSEIAEHYDAIFVKGYDRSIPFSRYLTFDQNVNLLKQHFGDQRIAVVELSAQASRDLAVERIGLPEADVQAVIDAFSFTATDVLPEHYTRKIRMLSNLERYSMYARSSDSLRDAVKTKTDDNFDSRTSKVQPMLELLDMTDTVVELTGLEAPTVMAEVRAIVDELTETNWVEDMMVILEQQQHILTAEERLSMVIDEITTKRDEPVISSDALYTIRKFDYAYGTSERLELISGMVVSQAYEQLLGDEATDQQQTA